MAFQMNRLWTSALIFLLVLYILWYGKVTLPSRIFSEDMPRNTDLCLPYELSNGHWIGNSETSKPLRWVTFANCERFQWRDSSTTLEELNHSNISIVWSGNSITRHIYFRTTQLLNGSISRSDIHVDTESQFHGYDREMEKQLCAKDVKPIANFNYDKPACGAADCCGFCSCKTEVQGLKQYFIWQQEWFDDNLEQLWTNMLHFFDVEHSPEKRVFFILNAGLIWAWQEHEKSLERLRTQFEGFSKFVQSLPENVKVIYKASTMVKSDKVCNWYQAAQDGMLSTLLATIPAAKRPVYLDLRALTYPFIDFVDGNHYSGRTADATVDLLLHLILNYDKLYGSESRGLKQLESETYQG